MCDVPEFVSRSQLLDLLSFFDCVADTFDALRSDTAALPPPAETISLLWPDRASFREAVLAAYPCQGGL